MMSKKKFVDDKSEIWVADFDSVLDHVVTPTFYLKIASDEVFSSQDNLQEFRNCLISYKNYEGKL